MWLPIAILTMICAAIGAYIYFAEYYDYGGALPVPADRDEETTHIEERERSNAVMPDALSRRVRLP